MKILNRWDAQAKDTGSLDEKRKSFSLYYHEYFEGYYESRVTGPDGRQHIRRVYCDSYYRHRMSDRSWYLLKLKYFFLSVLAAVLMVYSGTRTTPHGNQWYVFFFVGITAILMFLLLYTVFNYLLTGRDCTNWEHKESSGRLILFSLLTGVSAVCQSSAILLAELLQNSVTPDVLSAFFASLASGIVVLALYREEKCMKYDRIPSGEKPPADSVRIW